MYNDFTNNSTISVGVSNVEVFKDCYQEVASRTIVNTSTGGQVISLGIGEEAISLSGFVLYPGGVWADNSESGYKAETKQINAISDIAGGTIAVTERIKMKGGY